MTFVNICIAIPFLFIHLLKKNANISALPCLQYPYTAYQHVVFYHHQHDIHSLYQLHLLIMKQAIENTHLFRAINIASLLCLETWQ